MDRPKRCLPIWVRNMNKATIGSEKAKLSKISVPVLPTEKPLIFFSKARHLGGTYTDLSVETKIFLNHWKILT